MTRFPAALLIALLPVASLAADGAVGAWNLQVEWPSGTTAVTLTVTEEGGGLSATWAGPRGRIDAREVRFEEGVLSFVLDVQEENGQSLALRYRGTVAGDEITGQIIGPRGNTFSASGRRAD